MMHSIRSDQLSSESDHDHSDSIHHSVCNVLCIWIGHESSPEFTDLDLQSVIRSINT